MSVQLTGRDENTHLEDKVYDILESQELFSSSEEIYEELKWAEIDHEDYTEDDVVESIENISNDEHVAKYVIEDEGVKYNIFTT